MTSLSTHEMEALEKKINELLENPEKLSHPPYQNVVVQVLRCLEQGTLRVMSPEGMHANCGAVPMTGDLKNWIVHPWVKQAILFAFRLRSSQTYRVSLSGNKSDENQGRIYAGEFAYNDKLDVRNNFADVNVRSVPGSIAREGCYVAPGVILMPSFVNIGAWVGENTMIDTWATAGSCAQIGSNVHVAGGVGIGGVLEPAGARPVIVGDNAFLGSRVILVEGVTVGSGAVIGANVCLTSSTPIYDMTTKEKKEIRGFVPPNAVVAAGTRSKEFAGGEVQLQCAYIIAYRSEKTNAKVSLNDILRDTGIPV